VKNLFKKLMEREKIEVDYNFDWTSTGESTSEKQEIANKNVNDNSTKLGTHPIKK